MSSTPSSTSAPPQLIIEHYTIPRIGSVKLKKLTTRHLQKLYKELLESGRIHIGKNQGKGPSTTTVRSVHLMLHCALDRAVKERLIQRNPSEDCIVPKPRKRPSEGRTGGPAVGGCGHPEQDDLGEQAVRPQPGWLPGADPAQDEELGTAGVHPPGGGGTAAPGA